MDNYYYFHRKYKIWMHRTPLKKVLNPILRLVQLWSIKPYVIASKTIFVNDKPHFSGYSFCRVEYVKEKINKDDLINIVDFRSAMINCG